MDKKEISSKEIEIKYKIPYPTITHYTNMGLLKVIGRRGNKRLYYRNQVSSRLKEIKTLVDKGFPLRLIRDKLLGLLVIIIVVFFTIPAQAQDKTLSLAEAINIALTNNPNIGAMVRAVKCSEYMHRAAAKEWLPTLTTDYNFMVFVEPPEMTDSTDNSTFPLADYTSYMLGNHVKMPLYTGGALQYKESIEKLGINISQMRLLEAKADLIQEVRVNYLNVLKMLKQLKVVDENLLRYLHHQDLTSKYFNVGLTSKNSLLQIKTKRAQAKQDKIIVEKNLKMARATLNVSMGIDINSYFRLVDDFSYKNRVFSLDNCFDLAKKHNPTYVAFIYLKERAKKVVELEKTTSRPKLQAQFSYYRHGKTAALKGDDYLSNNNMIGQVICQWEVFDWFKASDRTNARKQELESLISQQKSTADRMNLDIRESYLNLLAAQDKLSLAREEITFARENFRVAKLRYQEMVAKATEVNDALVLLRQARFDYYNAAFEYNIALARLERVIGANIDIDRKEVIGG